MARLKSIKSIANFGALNNFDVDREAQDFGQLNLIFGLNYSGKTTLSRLFESINRGEVPEKMSDAEYELILDSGKIITKGSPDCIGKIWVFNRYFVNAHLWRGQDGLGMRSFMVVDEGQKEAMQKINSLENKIKSQEAEATRQESALKELNDQIYNLDKECAAEIKSSIGSHYDIRKLKNEISSVKEVDVLPEDELAVNRLTASQANDYDKLEPASISLDALRSLWEHANTQLSTPTTDRESLARIGADDRSSGWVADGLALHEDKYACYFCGNKISDERRKKLSDAFAPSVFGDLAASLSKIKSDADALTRKYSKYTDDLIVPKERSCFATKSAKLDRVCDAFEMAVETIKKRIDEKIECMSAIIRIGDFTLGSLTEDEAQRAVSEYNNSIAVHNEEVNQWEVTQRTARGRITKHMLYLHRNRETRTDLESRIQTAKAEHERQIKRIAGSSQELEESKRSLHGIDTQVEVINSYLDQLIPESLIKAKAVGSQQTTLSRNEEPAYDMSEGERTAAGFAYFLAKLKSQKIDDLIVVIDDPISSLDHNRIFATYSLVRESLGNAKQLFVLTHHTGFFSMTKEWMRHRDGSFFFLQREKFQTQDRRTLSKIPWVLDGMYAEYKMTLSLLSDIQNKGGDHRHLLGVPNLLRQVLETNLSFRYPKTADLKQRINKLIEDEVKAGKIYKVVNQLSHGDQPASIIDRDREVREVLEWTLDALKENDPEHFESEAKALT